jgi:hypothetical protein
VTHHRVCTSTHHNFAHSSPHVAIVRSPVLDVQVYNRRRTYLVTKPACSAPMNHRSSSKSMTKMGVCDCVLVCVLGVRHELYMSCAPASLCHPHAAHCDLCCLLAPRRNLQGTRRAWAVCGAARRCCVHATGVIRFTLANTCLLPAAAELLLQSSSCCTTH